MRKIVEGNRPEKPGNNLRKVEPAGNSKAIARRDAHPVSKNNNNIKVKPAHRGKKKKKKVLPVLIAVGVVALIGIIIAGVFGDQYYSDAMAMKDRMQNRAEQLKIYLGDFANYVKDSNYDAADGTIAKIDNITGEMRGELSDPKWQVATFVPGVGSDLKNADKLLGIVEEASNTILKPTVKYLRNNGFIEGKKNINTKLILSKDFSVKLGELAEYIDTVCPAAEKVLTDFNSIPEFKMEQIESKISKYRKIAKDNDAEIRAYLKFIKERSLKSYYQQSVACIVKLNVKTGKIHLELWQQADDGRGMTPCHEQSLMAFDIKGNSQLFAKYVMEILSERLALKKDKVAME